MTSTLITADLHLDDNSKNEYRHDFMEKTLPSLLKKHDCSRLLILGDIANEKDHHGAELVNRIASQLETLAKICPVIALAGNHDRIGSYIPFFHFVGKIKNITWISAPKIVGMEAFLPHTNNYKADWKGLDFKGLAWVYAHQTFAGANVGPRKLEGIPLDYFPPHTQIISGDIHVPQTINSNNGPVLVQYVGAPYNINFGDDYKPKVLLVKGKDMSPIAVPGPRKHLIEVDGLGSLEGIPEFEEGDMIKVRMTLNQDQFEKWPEIKKQIQEWGKGYVIAMIQPVLNAKVRAKKISNFSRKSDIDQLQTYAGKRAVSDKVLEAGLKLMDTK